jgi:hypothetical protein
VSLAFLRVSGLETALRVVIPSGWKERLLVGQAGDAARCRKHDGAAASVNIQTVMLG